MRVYRIASEKYAADFSGKGAEIAGGRWNSKGTALIYTSDSRALSMVEVCVHLPISIIPSNFKIIEIEIPDTIIIEKVDLLLLEKDWNRFPYKISTQVIGDEFIQKQHSYVLRVPSSIVKGDYNFLINPKHILESEIRIIQISDFKFDDRFFKMDESSI